jgi:hypothetical protein
MPLVDWPLAAEHLITSPNSLKAPMLSRAARQRHCGITAGCTHRLAVAQRNPHYLAVVYSVWSCYVLSICFAQEQADVQDGGKSEELCMEAGGLAGFTREFVVQAKLNEMGNYGMCLCRTQNFCCRLKAGPFDALCQHRITFRWLQVCDP